MFESVDVMERVIGFVSYGVSELQVPVGRSRENKVVLSCTATSTCAKPKSARAEVAAKSGRATRPKTRCFKDAISRRERSIR